MRFFLYTYAIEDNFRRSCEYGVFGAKRDGTGLETKVKQLRRGDLILIRKGDQGREAAEGPARLEFFGCCKVAGTVLDQSVSSPYRDLLWSDEVSSGTVLYPLRVAADFGDVPRLRFPTTWDELDGLNFRNLQGELIVGARSWQAKFRGNFVEDEAEFQALAGLLRLWALPG